MRLGFIGMGHIARAVANGLIRTGALRARDICGYAPHYDRLAAYAAASGVTACKTADEAVEWADFVVISVKPQVVEEAVAPLRARLAGKNILSFVSGWGLREYRALLGEDACVQCLLPNIPCETGEGMLLLENQSSLPPEAQEELTRVFSRIGLIEALPESLMGIGIAVAACGPAFVAMALEALADAGVKYGLPRATAYRLVSQMVKGTGTMQLQTAQHPGVLKDGVCSPGGITIRGVEALENAGMRAAFFAAVNAVME